MLKPQKTQVIFEPDRIRLLFMMLDPTVDGRTVVHGCRMKSLKLLVAES